MSMIVNAFGPRTGMDAVPLRSMSGVDGVGSVPSGGVRAESLTFSAGVDVSRSLASGLPDIDAPSAAEEGAVASLCAKLGTGGLMNIAPEQIKTMCREMIAMYRVYAETLAVAGLSGIGEAGASRSVMFDIYALMALMVECGQKMRDAARDVRRAENQQVQASIQNQADAQRSAALTGIVSALAVGLVQISMQVTNLAGMSKGFKQQLDAQKRSGIADAESRLKAAEMRGKPQDARANLEKVAGKTSGDARDRVERSFSDSRSTKADIGLADSQIKSRLQANEDALKTLKDAPPERISAAKVDRDAMIADLEMKIAADRNLLETPRDGRIELFRAQVKSELSDIRDNPETTPEELAYAEAFAANEIAQNSTPRQLAADVMAAKAEYDQANLLMQHDANYMKGVHTETRSRILGDMIAAFGGVGQGCVSNVTEMLRAEATEIGAEQQVSQEMLDQAKDLFAQCQSLVDSVIQLMRAVLQAEVQSMHDAIMA